MLESEPAHFLQELLFVPCIVSCVEELEAISLEAPVPFTVLLSSYYIERVSLIYGCSGEHSHIWTFTSGLS